MLILRRREGESILVGDDVEIEIIQIGANKVKIGVRAPDRVRVMRKEIRIVGDQNVVAAALSPDLRKIIVDQLCGKSTLNIFAEPPISPLTDTSGT
jgi:carbon storage regulator